MCNVAIAPVVFFALVTIVSGSIAGKFFLASDFAQCGSFNGFDLLGGYIWAEGTEHDWLEGRSLAVFILTWFLSIHIIIDI